MPGCVLAGVLRVLPDARSVGDVNGWNHQNEADRAEMRRRAAQRSRNRRAAWLAQQPPRGPGDGGEPMPVEVAS